MNSDSQFQSNIVRDCNWTRFECHRNNQQPTLFPRLSIKFCLDIIDIELHWLILVLVVSSRR